MPAIAHKGQIIMGGDNGVTSFNGRTGAVLPVAGDYSAKKITFSNIASGLSATDVQDALDELASEKQDTLTFDNSPTQNSDNPVKSGGVYTALQGKQDTLTFDNTPTASSNNPVKSGGVYDAVGKWTSAVSCAIGDTTCTITDAKITTASNISAYSQTASGKPVTYESIVVTTGQAVITFMSALEEVASIKLQIF